MTTGLTVDGKMLMNDLTVRPDLLNNITMRGNWEDAQNHPEIGLHYINTFGEVIEIKTTTNINQAKLFKESVGIISRKDKEFKEENPDHVQFKGLPVPKNAVPVFMLASPSFLKDCPQMACHLAPPDLSDLVVQRLEECNVLFLDTPLFQCH